MKMIFVVPIFFIVLLFNLYTFNLLHVFLSGDDENEQEPEPNIVEIIILCTNSMSHNEKQFNEWWPVYGEKYKKYKITKEQFMQFPYNEGLNCDEGPFYQTRLPVPINELKLGDVITFTIVEKCRGIYTSDVKGDIPLTHRIIKIEDGIITTQGDNNSQADELFGNSCLDHTKPVHKLF